MSLPMTCPTRHPKTHVFRIRMAVPKVLRTAVGKSELIQTLGTRDPAEAKRLAPAVVERFEAIIARARDGVQFLTDRDVAAMCGEWYRGEVARIGDTPGRELDWEMAEEQLQGRWHPVSDDPQDAPELIPEKEDREEAGALLQSKGYPSDPRTVGRVAARLVETKLMLATLMRRRAVGDWSDDRNEKTFPDAVVRKPAPRPKKAVTGEAATSVSALTEPFLALRLERDKTTHQVIAQERDTLRIFREICGDRLVGDFQRADVSNFLDTARKLPSKRGRSPKDKKLMVADFIERAEKTHEPTLSDKTLKRHLAALSSFFRFAVDRGFLTNAQRGELVREHRFRVAKKARAQRGAWTSSELVTLFSSPVWRGCESANARWVAGDNVIRDARFWLPLLALYHGHRLEEFADLYRRDVGYDEEAGCAFLRLEEDREGDAETASTSDKERRLKNENAERNVPLHPELIRMGFLAYVRERAPNPDDPLFPDLPPQGPDRKRGPRITRWFVTYRRAIGVYRAGVGMHAFRHVANTRLRDVISGFQQERHVAYLLGHSMGGGEGRERYDKGPGLKAIADTLALLRYPELDFSPLYVAA